MPSVSDILIHCTAQLAEILEMDPASITPSSTFAGLGLDSAMAVHFVIAVEEWLGIELYPSVTEDYPSLEAFCGYVAAR